MAILSTTQFALRNAKAAGTHSPLAVSDDGAKFRGFWFSYTISATATSGSTLRLVVIPANTRVIGVDLGSTTQAASVTFAIGDEDDPDRLMASLAVTTAVVPDTRIKRSPTTEEPDIGFGYKYTAATQINLTTGGATAQAGLVWGVLWCLVD